MKRLLCFIFVVTASLFANDIAIVKEINGSPIAKRDGQDIHLSVGDKVQNNDILLTNSSSTISIIFNDGSVLTLGESSFLNIEEFSYKPIEEQYEFTLSLDKGKAMFESGKIGEVSPENFEFKIPNGTIGIRGTKFIINLN